MFSSLVHGITYAPKVLSLYNDLIDSSVVATVYDLGYFTKDGEGEQLLHYPRLLIPSKALDITIPLESMSLEELDTPIGNIRNVYNVLYVENFDGTRKDQYFTHGFPSAEQYIRNLILKLRSTIQLNGTLPDNYSEICDNPEQYISDFFLPKNYLAILQAREVAVKSTFNPQAKDFVLPNPTGVTFKRNVKRRKDAFKLSPSELNARPAPEGQPGWKQRAEPKANQTLLD